MEKSFSQNELIEEFGYLLEKIKNSPFQTSPFKHLLMFDFLSQEHFQKIVNLEEIKRPTFSNTESLIEDLLDNGYKVHNFPGCTTSKEEYLKCYNSGKWPVSKGDMEGFGLTLRLKEIDDQFLSRLMYFFNSELFSDTLKEKFGVNSKNKVNTAVQKYLHAYEISPHPDERNKALTYLLNINTDPAAENDKIHTQLLKFKAERQYIYDFWRYNPTIERCWVPWNWCDAVIKTNINNSFIMFAPSDDTLHAVKLDYDHLKYQRTQIYGNLFYETSQVNKWVNYNEIDLLKEETPKFSKIRAIVPEAIKKVLR